MLMWRILCYITIAFLRMATFQELPQARRRVARYFLRATHGLVDLCAPHATTTGEI